MSQKFSKPAFPLAAAPFATAALGIAMLGVLSSDVVAAPALTLEQRFTTPPDGARPWVYWYFMDGNITREGIHADLEAMQKAGIGGVVYLEVGIGIPRGPVAFMSTEWQGLFAYAVSEAKRLGIEIALGTGPGWTGSGGPWVKPELSMQHLVASETNVAGPTRFDGILPRPQPRTPTFGEGNLTPELREKWLGFYEDEAVLAFPTPEGKARIAGSDQKALYYRAPYSSAPGTAPRIGAPANFSPVDAAQSIASDQIVVLTSKLGADGRLNWEVPPGQWTIMRFGRTPTGITTRPAPAPGLGFESDKFSRAALDDHLKSYQGNLFKQLGPNFRTANGGLTMLHFDSWEMGSQNWSQAFKAEFITRRGYDPTPFLPAMTGYAVGSTERSERFLWDLRQTASDLVIENHALRLKAYAHKNGMTFSVEPYDLNPIGDLDLGATADLPMGEFWSRGFGFLTEYSVFEAVSVGHTNGKNVIGAEAFTANGNDHWLQYPGAMKAQLDWALCAGLNKFAIHTYQHQPDLTKFPGMTMGAHGVHWERTQTWWDMVPAFHQYITRTSEMLRQGIPVADILYLTPEGVPQVFTPPADALTADLPDRKGHSFDGCSPKNLLANARVKDGQITFPDGMSYRVLVLPNWETMTPQLLRKITQLVEGGATVIGNPPQKSPSLTGYPASDAQVRALAAQLWNGMAERKVGKGRIIRAAMEAGVLYPAYASTAKLLESMGVAPDFASVAPMRSIHRRLSDGEMYFVANVSAEPIETVATFRVVGLQPQWWNPINGEKRDLTDYASSNGLTKIPMRLGSNESGFVVFRKASAKRGPVKANFPLPQTLATLANPWNVSFDPKWGGPENITFPTLTDWTQSPEDGIKHYSGKAVYKTSFDAPAAMRPDTRYDLSLGDVKNLASVRLNGRDLGSLWCAPWRVGIPVALLKTTGNQLEITVANLWTNRLIGDRGKPANKRFTSTTFRDAKADLPLQPSGLLGPVALEMTAQ